MRTFGLIGKSLGHSFSKAFFTDFFERNEIHANYINIEVPEVGSLKDALSGEFAGLNVTIPYKEEVIPFLDDLSEEARKIGAVNTIQFVGERLIGHNTDSFGFHQSIKPFLRNIHERAIVFGDGGAAKAVKYVLSELGIDIINVVRNKSTEEQFLYTEVNDYMMQVCKLIVNTTPVGTYPDIDKSLPVPLDQFTPEHLVVDLIYNPERTVLLSSAESAGSMVVNGEVMLKAQAMKAWGVWNS